MFRSWPTRARKKLESISKVTSTRIPLSYTEYNFTYDDAPRYKSYITSHNPQRRTGYENRDLMYQGWCSGLKANYDMERSETVLLKDHFVERGSPGKRELPCSMRILLNYDGRLYGNPGFVRDKEGRRGAFTLNGSGQYAEVGPMVGDYAEITINTAIKTAGGGRQTMFDFGSSKDFYYKLVLNNLRPELTMTVDGKSETVATSAKIPASRSPATRIPEKPKLLIFDDVFQLLVGLDRTHAPLDVPAHRAMVADRRGEKRK